MKTLQKSYSSHTFASLSALFAFGALVSYSSAMAQLFTEVNAGFAAFSRPCVVWGDYDGDGDLDVLIAGPGKHDVSITTIYNNTSGTFADSGIVVLPLQFATAAWGDFDGDGDLDLAMTGLTTAQVPTTRIYRNNNGTSFTPVAGTFTGVYAGTLTWADFDNDGDLDLLVTGVTTTGPVGIAATRLYRNDGNGVFTSIAHPFPDVYLGAVAAGDYDNDGDLDVVVTGVGGNTGLNASLWKNDGAGHFVDAAANLPGMDIGFAVWGDYDNDGDLDLLFGGDSYDGWISRIYRNDAGTLIDANAGLLAEIWSSAAWGDFDNDGDLDIAILGYDPVAQVRVSRVYRNEGDVFANTGQAFHELFLGTLSWTDYDNDGDLDLLIAGNTGLAGNDFTSIYRNNCLVSNTPPSAPANLAANVGGTSVTLSWSAATDGQTPGAGLSYNLRVGTTPGGSDIVSPQSLSDGRRLLVSTGNANQNLTAKLTRLKPGTNYFWSVQAVDSGFAGSTFATEGMFTALAELPGAGTIVTEAVGNIRVTWVGSPGSPYQVLSSTNLMDWSLLSTPVAASDGSFSVIEPAGFDAKFYRAARP